MRSLVRKLKPYEQQQLVLFRLLQLLRQHCKWRERPLPQLTLSFTLSDATNKTVQIALSDGQFEPAAQARQLLESDPVLGLLLEQILSAVEGAPRLNFTAVIDVSARNEIDLARSYANVQPEYAMQPESAMVARRMGPWLLRLLRV